MANPRMHPEDGDLLRYCDGEMRARETSRLARHLEACWDCRTRLDDLKQTIAEYVRYTRDVCDPGLPPPPQPWRNLRAEFARVPADDLPAGWKRIFQLPTVWLAACALTAGTGVLFYATRPGPPEAVRSARPVAPPAAVTTVSPAPPPRQTLRPVPRPVAPGPADELRVIAALDHIGADLGDPIEVVRSSDRIVVTCFGLDAERMRQVQAALAVLPRVAVKLSPKPNVSTAGAPMDVVGAPHAAMRAGLARQFDSPAADEKFVDGLLKSSEAMMARAHALRALAARFPPDVEARMSADDKALLAALCERHETALGREVVSLERAVHPLLGPSAPALPGTPGGSWQARTARMFVDAAQVDQLLGAVFAGSQRAAAGDANGVLLAAALAKLEADVAP